MGIQRGNARSRVRNSVSNENEKEMKVKAFFDFMRTRGFLMILHVAIMLLSAWLIYIISVDTFKNVSFYESNKFQKQQFWICVVFMADFVIEFFLAKRKWHYLCTHFIFLLVSIPYQAILYHYGWHLSKEVAYLVRYMPLIRGGYAMAIVVSWFTYNKATGLFFTYIITLLSTVYFASLTFYLFEFGVNPDVHTYKDALWWACMDVTTVGSNIEAITGVGRVLSVLLAALGMMMFPIFTVYVTNVITRRSKQAASHNDELSLVKAYHTFIKNHPDEAASLEEQTVGDNRPQSSATTGPGSASTNNQ